MAPTDLFTLDVLRNYLLIGAALFALGMLGFLSRRNLIVMFLSVEMMLQGTALSLVGFRPLPRHVDRPGLHDRDPDGRGVRGVDRAGLDRDPVQPPVVAGRHALARHPRGGRGGRRASGGDRQEAEPIEPTPGPESYPHLTPAGVEPAHPVQPWIERRR